MVDVDGKRLIGEPLDRVDGRLKVTGGAIYAAENFLPDLAHAVVVQSTIARGRIDEVDAREARALPGVLDVVTWQNAPRLKPFEANPKNRPGQTYLLLQDDAVRYYGQHIAIVIAETLEQAREAATLLRIRYSEEAANAHVATAQAGAFKPARITVIDAPAVDSKRGDPEAAFRAAPIRLEFGYTSVPENHNAMEPHATVARWDGDDLLLIDSTQWVFGVRNMVATHLGIAPERVRVVSPFVGGGFGSKGNPWPHPTLAALAARHVGRPVKLVLGRPQMFAQVGHRPATLQQFRLGAEEDGKLQSLAHHVISGTSQFDDYVESAGATARVAYSCANVETTHRLVRLDVNTPCPMRAPGEALGNFAVECAMDELAYRINVDPLEIRLRNYAERDEDRKKPFSSKSLKECYAQASQRFGWKDRRQAPRGMRDGAWLIGWGMASSIFTVKLSAASARVQLHGDGSVVVSTASHDIGTGAYTALAQVAAEELGVPASRVSVRLADTELPQAPASAGSQTSGSVGSAIVLAAREVRQQLIQRAIGSRHSALFGLPADAVTLSNGFVVARDRTALCVSWAQLLAKEEMLEGLATWTPPSMDARDWSGFAFGAHFCEVAVDEALGHVKVRRWVGGFAAGRILNEKTARSQLMGGIVWGIGQALLEQAVYDNRSTIVNNNLADYLVPVNADTPAMDVLLVAEADGLVNPAGAKGLGELGTCGAAAAIANALFHATGVRHRDLPITPDRILAS